MRLVRATEKRTGQTESAYESMWRCGVIRPSFVLTFVTRSLLECSMIKGDNPVEEAKRIIGRYLEYCLFEIRQEIGGHQPPTLNMS